MDAELSESQIVLAQKLACGEPTIRKRTIRLLENWVKETSKKHEFNDKSMDSLCKGLYYGMWMQDKMLLQERLANFFGKLLNFFDTEAQSARYLKCFFNTISKEWPRIDRWRMDKYLMLMRRLTRATFTRLKLNDWSPSMCETYFAALKETVLSTEGDFVDGLKSHFAALYLDELDNAGGLSVERVNDFLLPYVKLLSEKSLSDYFFNSILDEIFITILHSYAEEQAAADAGEEAAADGEDAAEKQNNLQFDYAGIAAMLFEIGKLKTITSKRRKRIYLVVKRFNRILDGTFGKRRNPIVDRHTERIERNKEFVRAVNALLMDQRRNSVSRKKFKKSKLKTKRKLTNDEESDENVVLRKKKTSGKVEKAQTVIRKKGIKLKKKKRTLSKKKLAA